MTFQLASRIYNPKVSGIWQHLKVQWDATFVPFESTMSDDPLHIDFEFMLESWLRHDPQQEYFSRLSADNGMSRNMTVVRHPTTEYPPVSIVQQRVLPSDIFSVRLIITNQGTISS